MKKIILFGDIHFSSINKWKYEAGEHFIEWFRTTDFGPKEDTEFIFVGDISEKDTNPGDTIDQMDRFFTYASMKAKWVHIIIGNHDKKLYYETVQHSLLFLSNKENITVYEDECEVTTPNGFNVLMMPWKRVEGKKLHDYYNEKLHLWNKKYDVIVGHWTISEPSKRGWMAEGVDIRRLNAFSYGIGHVHTRMRSEYLGSVFPNSTAEQCESMPSVYKILDEERTETFKYYPPFLKYVNVKYGEPIPPQEPNCAYTYTIQECNSKREAIEKYPEYKDYIKAVERVTKLTNADVSIGTDSVHTKVEATGFMKSKAELFDEMIKETKISLSRPTYMLVKKLITETITT